MKGKVAEDLKIDNFIDGHIELNDQGEFVATTRLYSTEDAKLIWDSRTGDQEFYLLNEDPKELESVIEEKFMVKNLLLEHLMPLLMRLKFHFLLALTILRSDRYSLQIQKKILGPLG